LNLPVEDTAEISIRFTNGVLGSIHLDYLQRPPSHWLEIIGTRGTLRWDNGDGITWLAQAAEGRIVETWQDFPPPQGFDRNKMFLEELRHFKEVLRGTEQPLCTLQDGEMALRLALAALSGKETHFD
jgi:predicted dehydrogenase